MNRRSVLKSILLAPLAFLGIKPAHTSEDSEFTTEHLRYFEQFLEEHFIPGTVEYLGNSRWIGCTTRKEDRLSICYCIDEPPLRHPGTMQHLRKKATYYKSGKWINWHNMKECKQLVAEANS
jgi:hypothetical protein